MKDVNPTWITPQEISRRCDISRDKAVLWLKSGTCPFGYGVEGPDGFCCFALRTDFDKWFKDNSHKFTGKIKTTWVTPYEVSKKLNMSIKKIEIWLDSQKCPFGWGTKYNNNENNIFLHFIFRADFDKWYNEKVKK